MSKLLQLAILLVVLKFFAPEIFTLAVDILTKILTIISELISSFQSQAPTLDLQSFTNLSL